MGSRRLRIAMYTAADPDNDTRVLREADTLATAGHDVVLIARVRAANAVPEDSRRGSGARVVRIARTPIRSWMWYPWRARHVLAHRTARDLRSGPYGWAAAAGRALAVVAALPFISYRLVAWGLLGDSLPGPRGQLDYVLTTERSLRNWLEAAANVAPDADVHHGHDFTGLWAAVRAADRGRGVVVYDSHEFYSESGRHARQGSFAKQWLRRRERSLARHAIALVTVNAALERLLRHWLGFDWSVVVHNAPTRSAIEAAARRGGPDRLRAAAGVRRGTPIAIYHGVLAPHRGIEELAQALLQPGLEGVHGVLLGYGSKRDELARLAAEPRFDGRLHVLEAVPPDDLLDWLSTADVAVMPIQPSTLNHRYSTPNKLFEALGAGVPVVGSDFIGFRRVLGTDPERRMGFLVDPTNVEAIAAGIRAVLELSPSERKALRARCRAAALERWNWEREAEPLLSMYEELAKRQS